MSPDQRIALLEARIAELERRSARPRPMRPTRRLAILVLAAALTLPAGAVLASHKFGDVPTNHQFHNAISAIADAGITTGCGGGNYCPNGLVTRGQMAAFLSRLGALQPGSAPKVNADRLDGRHASAFVRPAFAIVAADGTLLAGAGVTSTTRTTEGVYRVRFDRVITSCGISATVDANFLANPRPSSTLIQPDLEPPAEGREVRVELYHLDGVMLDLRDSRFHLVAICNDAA